jgi:hypothetical protein
VGIRSSCVLARMTSEQQQGSRDQKIRSSLGSETEEKCELSDKSIKKHNPISRN